MKLKTVEVDGKTYAETSDGKPLYVEDDGKEIAFDAPGTRATISRLNGEAKGHREAKEAAEASLKQFEGITDPDAAKKALNTVKNLDDKKLVDAGEVDKVKTEAIKAVKAEFEPVVKERDELQAELRQEKIGGAFARSKFIADKMARHPEEVQNNFGKHFSIESGKVVAKDASGNQIFSRSKPGEAAEFEEALEILVDQSPYKDSLLKSSGHAGGDSKPNAPSTAAGGSQAMGGDRTERQKAIASKFPDLPQS